MVADTQTVLEQAEALVKEGTAFEAYYTIRAKQKAAGTWRVAALTTLQQHKVQLHDRFLARWR